MQDGGRVHLERGFPEETRRALARMGHNVIEGETDFGGYQAVLRDHVRGAWYGASEARKDGQAAGY